ncbi:MULTISPECIES: Crp/Fnr family transcriptional regulator [Sporosarcina]|uniref:Crp/Fnr family transcriptional regulator n=1 Tax=Sporosarcina TaxID=1569 RepID=UPI0030FB8215
MFDSYLKEGQRMFVKKNTVIYEQGTIGDGFYYVADGLVKMSMRVFEGKERILEIIEKGKTFGELSMDHKCYFSSAIAMENSVIYYLEYKKNQELIMKNKNVRDMICNTVINKLKRLGDIIQYKSLPVEEQLAYLLIGICHENNSYEIPLNQQQLSQFTGLTRITIYKVTKEWNEKNLILKKEGKLFIRCPESLQEYVSAL